MIIQDFKISNQTVSNIRDVTWSYGGLQWSMEIDVRGVTSDTGHLQMWSKEPNETNWGSCVYSVILPDYDSLVDSNGCPKLEVVEKQFKIYLIEKL